MMHIVACTARYGSGGLGQHLAELVEDARTRKRLDRYYCAYPLLTDSESGLGIRVESSAYSYLERYTPIRWSPGWRNFLTGDLFDRFVAKLLDDTVESFTGFGGQSLFCFRRARALGAKKLTLIAANSHVYNVNRQHCAALTSFPIESSWLNSAQHGKTVAEYAMADSILVASEYSRKSFLDRGVPPAKLEIFRFSCMPRFVPCVTTTTAQDKFRIVYVGSLTVVKGIPILVNAFKRLDCSNAELVLVGGWATRGMKRYLVKAISADPRIKIRPGDPLPYLQTANVLVHPSYEDGFAYAPMEALACGVPVIVTDDTGMKDYVCHGKNGHIVPTGDVESLVTVMNEYLHRHTALTA